MHRQLMRVMMSATVGWLRERMSPAGRTALHDLEARSMQLIGSVQDHAVPQVEEMTPDALKVDMDWLMTHLPIAYPDPWAFVACESIRLLVHRNAEEMVDRAYPPSIPQEKAGKA